MSAIADRQIVNRLPGIEFPLGATVTRTGTNFAVASEVANTTMRYDRARNHLDRHPKLHPRRLHGLRHLTSPATSSLITRLWHPSVVNGWGNASKCGLGSLRAWG